MHWPLISLLLMKHEYSLVGKMIPWKKPERIVAEQKITLRNARASWSDRTTERSIALLRLSRNVMTAVKVQNLILLSCTSYSLNFKVYVCRSHLISERPLAQARPEPRKRSPNNFKLFFSPSLLFLSFFLSFVPSFPLPFFSCFAFLTACSVLRTCSSAWGR